MAEQEGIGEGGMIDMLDISTRGKQSFVVNGISLWIVYEFNPSWHG